MITTLLGVFFWITIALMLVNIIVMFAWKRKDVSLMEASLKYPFRYGPFWCWKQPQLYFKERYAKLAIRLAILWTILFLITVLLFIGSPYSPIK